VDSQAIIWIVQTILILVLLYLAYVDWHTFRLPNAITFPLIVLGIVFNGVSDLRFTTFTYALIGAFLGYGSLWALNAGYRLLKNRNGIGMGDAKLLAALAAWLGLSAIPSILLLASTAGIIGGIIWLKWRGQQLQQAFPFGPFLAIAGIIELL
jgi:leader peptidase (prepilin peptidase)/N-methyltransferase